MISFLFLVFRKLSDFCIKVIFALYDFRVLRLFTRFIAARFKFKKDVLIKVRGKKMYANTLDRIAALYLWKHSILEGYETVIMKDVIKEGMVVLDIGANIGYYTLQFAGLVGEKGKVFSFEPDPDNYRLLIKNIEQNNYKNVVPIQKAVSDKTGRSYLFLCEDNKGDHRIFDSKDDKRHCIEIETVALDDFFSAQDQVDVIKMDIQGAEYLGLLGMEKLIKGRKNIILVVEFSPILLKKCCISERQFIDKIIDYGFKPHFINERKKRIELIPPNDLIQICHRHKFSSLYIEKNEN